MKIVPRSQWSHETWGRLTPLRTPVGELWVHHGASGSPTLATLRSYDRYHVRNRKWQALGYNYAIVGDGTVYEGRGLHVGAHTVGRNSVSIGVVLVGNFTSSSVPQPMIEALAELTKHLHAVGVLRLPVITGGHGQAPGSSTACPGRGGLAAIDAARQLLTDPKPDPEEAELKALVTRIQTDCAEAGFDPGPVDGLWGPLTDAAYESMVAAAVPKPPPDPFAGKALEARTTVNFYDSPRWSSPTGTFSAGQKFPQVEGVTEQGGHRWYRVRNSRGAGPFYVTTRTDLVNLV